MSLLANKLVVVYNLNKLWILQIRKLGTDLVFVISNVSLLNSRQN